MTEYKHDNFYNIQPLIPRIDEFKKDAIEHSYDIRLEQKYKNDVNHREPTDKSLEWIMDKCVGLRDIKMVHRYKNYPSQKEHLQVVFTKDWYFAWVSINTKHLDYFVDKYNLKVLK